MDRIRELERAYDELLREKQAEVIAYIEDRKDLLAKHDIHHADFHLPLRPMFLTREQVQHVQDGVRALWRGLLEVYARVFEGDAEKAAHVLGAPRVLLPWLERCFAPERQVDELFGRPDGFMWDGRIQFIEQNITSGAGGLASTHALTEFFDDFPVLQALKKQVPVEKMSPIEAYSRWFSSKEFEGKNVGYLDATRPETGERYEDQGLLFLEHLRARGVKLRDLTYRDVSFREDGIYLDGERIHCIYRGVAAIALLWRLEELAPYFEACGRGVAEMVISPHELVLFDKLLLPYLSDEDLNGFLSDELKAVMPSILPWTRFLRDQDTHFQGTRVNVLELCRRRQRGFILKRGDGFGSNAVVVGSEHSPQAWEEHLARALREGNWVVQEMLSPPEEGLPFLHDRELLQAHVVSMTCPYMMHGKVIGIASRTSVPRGSRVLVGAGAKGSQSGIRTAFRVG